MLLQPATGEECVMIVTPAPTFIQADGAEYAVPCLFIVLLHMLVLGCVAAAHKATNQTET